MPALCRELITYNSQLIALKMAIAYVRSTVASRGNGKSATAMAAYRSGSKIRDQASGKVHDYTQKLGVDHSVILSPIVAAGKNQWLTDREKLWNNVEGFEKRYDAQLSREIVIAIPRELSNTDKVDLVCQYVQSSFVDRGMIADINIHHLDGNNPHAHVMLTMRDLVIDEQGNVTFANKNRSWNDKKLYQKQKLEWDKIANNCLERSGSHQRIDSRSYEEQGIDKIPQIHLGARVCQMRAQGIATDHGNLYDQIAAANDQLDRHVSVIRELERQLVEVTTPKIPKITTATTDHQFTPPPKRDLQQERKDADLLLVAKTTPEYQAVAQRAKARYQQQVQSIPQPIPTPAPEPEVKKWTLTQQQPTNPQLVESILATASQLGVDNYQAGNYRVRVTDQKIEIDYQDKLAMTINLDLRESQLIDPKYSLDGYERGLGRSLDVVMTDLAHEQGQQQQELELQQQQEKAAAEQVIVFDDDVEIRFDDAATQENRSRDYDWSR
jgi:MobA/MobL family